MFLKDMKIKYIFMIIFLVFLFDSCKKHKIDNVEKDNKNGDVETTISHSEVDAAFVKKISNIYKEQDTFSTVELSFNVKAQLQDRNLSASGQMRIANDSIMWMFVKVLGFEAVRAKFTQDSVVAVVKLKNMYFKEDYSAAKNYLPVAADLSIIQSIFLDKFFIFPENKIENLSFFSSSNVNDNLLTISTTDNVTYSNKYSVDNEIVVDTDNNKMTSNKVIMSKSGKVVTIKYSEYEDIQGHLFPKVIDISMDSSSVVFSITKVSFGKKLNFPITIPANYKPFNIK